ncbi:MAG: hypothetical protein KKD77_23300 [Gammaproteobacteria bacterium]|nr:hypothetical protein [Gammaproteobacteria bacterium]
MLKLKRDENGNVVVVDGKPVYIHEDGKEAPFDASAAMDTIHNLNGENAERRKANEALVKALNSYSLGEEDGKPVFMDPEVAKKALETVKNLDDKKLVDAGQMETLKMEMNKAFTQKEEDLKKSFKLKEEAYVGEVKKKSDTIFELMVKSQFSNSPTIQDKTILPADIASNYFGKHFVVEGDGPDAKVIGYINGEKIFSRERPGEPAHFEEALSVIIDTYPMKERILKATAGGAGGGGGQGNQNRGGTGKRDESFYKLPAVERLKAIHSGQGKAGGHQG